MGKIINLTGQKFGKLTVIELSGYDNEHRALWKCKCDCGNEITARSNNLRRKLTQSCGCIRNKTSSENNKKHGMHGTNLYNRWKSMKGRCNDKNNPVYGGKGITVCEEWKNDFEAFYKWSIENGYSPELQIDRIDGNGNYEPNNCRWVTVKVNMENRESTKKVVVTEKGKSYVCASISEASKITGVPTTTLCRALQGKKIRNKRYQFDYEKL